MPGECQSYTLQLNYMSSPVNLHLQMAMEYINQNVCVIHIFSCTEFQNYLILIGFNYSLSIEVLHE